MKAMEIHPKQLIASPRFRTVGLVLTVVLMAGLLFMAVEGHGKSKPVIMPTVSDIPTVRIVHPQLRTITREVGQPSFVYAYEQTSIFAKLSGYVEKWIVDIGDKLTEGELMATLFIPELVEEYESKKATVQQSRALVEQAKRLVEVAQSNVKASIARVAEEKANVGKYQAAVERWNSEVQRLTGLAKEGVVDRQVLDESVRQLQTNTAAKDAALATVDSAIANQLAYEASLAKAKVDVDVTEAALKVAIAEQNRLAALVGYTKLTAPYDGVVVARNANTGDFVLPAGGDPSAVSRRPINRQLEGRQSTSSLEPISFASMLTCQKPKQTMLTKGRGLPSKSVHCKTIPFPQP